METTVHRILAIFRANHVRAGQVLSKKVMMDEIKGWPPQEKLLVRDAWHVLTSQGLIREGHPDGPTLTTAGEKIAYSA